MGADVNVTAVRPTVQVDAAALGRLIDVERATYRFFERMGLPYKPVRSYRFADAEGCPTWCDGVVTFCRGIPAYALAHELGHGCHEACKDRGRRLPPEITHPAGGEQFAEAVRYFVEVQEGTGSEWLRWAREGRGACYLVASLLFSEDAFRVVTRGAPIGKASVDQA